MKGGISIFAAERHYADAGPITIKSG